MVKVIISHEVKNFTDWKKGFDKDETNRVRAGVKITGVYSSVSNPNYVTVISEFPSAEAANGFMKNPELKENMNASGVISVPTVQILTPVY